MRSSTRSQLALQRLLVDLGHASSKAARRGSRADAQQPPLAKPAQSARREAASRRVAAYLATVGGPIGHEPGTRIGRRAASDRRRRAAMRRIGALLLVASADAVRQRAAAVAQACDVAGVVLWLSPQVQARLGTERAPAGRNRRSDPAARNLFLFLVAQDSAFLCLHAWRARAVCPSAPQTSHEGLRALTRFVDTSRGERPHARSRSASGWIALPAASRSRRRSNSSAIHAVVSASTSRFGLRRDCLPIATRINLRVLPCPEFGRSPALP